MTRNFVVMLSIAALIAWASFTAWYSQQNPDLLFYLFMFSLFVLAVYSVILVLRPEYRQRLKKSLEASARSGVPSTLDMVVGVFVYVFIILFIIIYSYGPPAWVQILLWIVLLVAFAYQILFLRKFFKTAERVQKWALILFWLSMAGWIVFRILILR